MGIVAIDDRYALIAMVCRSFWLIDNGRASESADLFARGAGLTFGPGAPRPGTIEGEAIRQSMIAREALQGVTSRHVITNFLIETDAEGTATIRSLLTLFRTEDDLSPIVRSVADIIDDCEIEDGRWQIRRRQILPIFGLA